MFTDELSTNGNTPDSHTLESAEGLPRSIQQAICLLMKASKYAADTGQDSWEFALTIGELRRNGVAENELRWLVCRGFIEHAHEITTTGKERTFNHHVSLRFGKRSAFVITSAGVAFRSELTNGSAHGEIRDGVAANSFGASLQRNTQYSIQTESQSSSCNGCPKWDRDRRELRIGGKIVKVFKLPSPMQESILMAFEEEHWPPRIDDPLPGHPDYHPKRRLHDTIKSLNRNQKHCLIRFMGDGTGEGIRWELVPAKEDADQAHLDVVLQ